MATTTPVHASPRLDGGEITHAPLQIVTIGHVDHGKSTLIGRLLHDAGGLPAGRLDEIRAMCKRRGMPFEWAFVTDACQAERDQGITIDISEVRLRRPEREYVFIDAPGHREFVRNMLTGAARADVALMLIDAAEGVREQTWLHGMLAQLVGLRSIIVVVNKMDLAGFDQARFAELADRIGTYLGGLGVKPIAIVPIAARDGDNIVESSSRMGWYRGPTVLQAISGTRAAARPTSAPLRLTLQDVYKFDDRRILAGQVLSGRLAVGDTVLFSPANKTSRVRSIEGWPDAKRRDAEAGQSVGFTLDEQIFVERGQMVSLEATAPTVTNVLRLRVFWLANKPLAAGDPVTLKIAVQASPAVVREIHEIIDTETLARQPGSGHEIGRFQVAEITVRSQALLAVDRFDVLPQSGRVVLLQDENVVGCGLVLDAAALESRIAPTQAKLVPVGHAVDANVRAQRNGHRGGVIWLTGLSGAGKSTIAMGVEKELFRLGYQAYVLDGDNIRRGLNRDLGFGAEGRTENIRRVGEVAALFADAGFIAITSFISPYQSGRDEARRAAGDAFREIYIKADLATCEERDTKGLYKNARQGKISDFTGISAPYEEPITPDLVVDTTNASVEGSVKKVLDFICSEFRVPPGD